MHLPLQIATVSKIKHPPWSKLRIIGEHITTNENSDWPIKQIHDIVFLDSRQFIVQSFGNFKSQKIFCRFEALDVIKDDIIHVFLSNDSIQSSLGKIRYSLINS